MTARPAEHPAHWAQALGLSLALHGALGFALVDLLPRLTAPALVDPPRLEISRLTLDPTGIEGGGPASAPVGTTVPPVPVSPAALSPAPITPAAPVTPPVAAPAPVVPPLAPLVPIDTLRGALAPVPQAPAVAPVALPPAVPEGATPGGAGSGAAVSDLAQAIRDRLGDACLIALPEPEGTDGVRLTVMAPLDQQIGDFLGALDRTDLAGRTTERSVLMDVRQCPALAFARAADSYPVWPLSVRPDAGTVADGESLTGVVTGAGPVTLLLIDDNGVVQDLTRFTAAIPEGIAFDVPVRRAGEARDTAQLLLAVAGRPQAVTQLAGRGADQLFPALTAELGRGAQMGVAPFTIR